MGDFEEVVRLQAGIREWLLRAGRNGRHELRGIPVPAVLPLLCAAAFGSALTEAADLATATAVATVGILSSVGASALGEVLASALDRVRSAQSAGGLSRSDVQREISRSVKEVLSAGDARAGEVRSDIAMVLREIDAGGTVFRAAIEAGDEELQREVLAAVGALSAEFGELEFMLADLARAAGEIQDSLGGQSSELRTASDQVARRSADVRVIREELAVIEQRRRQWMPGSGGPDQVLPAPEGPPATGGRTATGPRPQARKEAFVRGAPPRPARGLFDEATIKANLDHLAQAQFEDGGWMFNWLAWSPTAEREWRGFLTVDALRILRANGRWTA